MKTETTWRRSVVGAGAAAVLVLAGCGSASDRLTEEIVERATGGEVEIDRDGDRIVIGDSEGGVVIEGEGGSFSVETEEGTAEFSTSADVPAEWLAVLEVFPGAEVVGVFEFSEGDSTSQKVSLAIDDTVEQVVEFYERTLTDAGFTEGSRLVQSIDGADYAQISFVRDDQTVTMLAFENEGQVDVSISLLS